MRFFFRANLMLCLLVLSFIAQSKEKPITFTGDWKIRNGVKKLYDTPMGSVFRFTPCKYFDFGVISKNNGKLPVHSLYFDLFRSSKDKRRFIVLEFKVRTFPAISKVKNPKLNFTLIRSNNSTFSKFSELNGISRFMSGKNWSGIRAPVRSPYWPPKKDWAAKWDVGVGLTYVPYYDITSFRYIFDTYKKGVVSTNVNGEKFIEPHQEIMNTIVPVKGFGICVQYGEFSYDKGYRNIMEISRPKVLLTDSEFDLYKLPPVKVIVNYPYSEYPVKYKNERKIKNPDALYAYAMHLLEGEDLFKGFEMLKKAAKEEHIFAMYQIGICYWRGIGVKQDINKAFKWLLRARKYSLPDAWAMYGILRMKNSPKIYLKQTVKNAVYRGMNELKSKYSKHSNWIMAKVFNNRHSLLPWWGIDGCSVKLDFWSAIANIRASYYKNIAAEPEDEYKIIKNGIREKIFNNKYYDVRFKTYSCPGMLNKIQRAIKEGFTPAIYYQGQLLAGNNIKEAMKLFQRGAGFGNVECEIEVLHCRARLKTLKDKDFTPELDAKFAEHPLYYMLRYMVNNPDAPGVKEFLSQKFIAAREIWRKNPTPWNNFMLGAAMLYRYFHYGFDTANYRLFYEKNKDIKEAFELLDQAARNNIVPAIYINGLFYLRSWRNKFAMERLATTSKGLELLNKAAKLGHPKAEYHLVKYQFKKCLTPDRKWLKILKPLRDAKCPDTWLLSSDILLKLVGYDKLQKKNIIGAYERAAKLGSKRALYNLGVFYYKNGKAEIDDKKRAAACWTKFIKLDKYERFQDLNDPYCVNIKPPAVIIYTPNPCPRMRTYISEKKAYHYIGVY